MFDFGIANEKQKEAVTCTEGPLLIIAGPGTGKTFTLVKRIAYLVFEKGVKPSEIMAITFTEKAAHQLVTRISDEFLRYSGCENINIDEMYIGTFHSVCLRLMKEYSELLPFDADKRIIDSFEQQYLVYNNLERFRSVKGYCRSDFNSMSKWEQAKAICKYTSTMSEELLSRDKLLDDKDADILVIAKVWDEYDKLLTENNATDFSTIQADAWRMMQDSDISASVREKIRYVMVDEYQDTNHIQEQLILAIGGKFRNICVVGDDDQGLYRFRGATIRNIFEFPKHFGENECRVIKLEENYRSEKGIIDLYNNWMTNPEYKRKFDWGKYRYPKQIYTSKKETYSSVYTCKGTYDDPARVKLAGMIKRMKQNGTVTDYNQIVFLFKSVRNDEAKKTAEFLEESGIPVYTPRSKLYFERAEVRQIIGCLICCFRTFTCFLKQQKDADKPSEISRYYISDCMPLSSGLLKENKELYGCISEIANDIAGCKDKTEYTLLSIFYRIIAFEPFRSYIENPDGSNARQARNLAEMSNIISKFCYIHDMHLIGADNRDTLSEEFFERYLRLLKDEGVGEYEDEAEYAPEGCISFMTIHQAKGLEFPVVIVGSLPLKKESESKDSFFYSVESRFCRKPFEAPDMIPYFDMWRKYYVAFSRAKNLLVLTEKDGSRTKPYTSVITENIPDISEYNDNRVFDRVKKEHIRKTYSFTSHISVYDECTSRYLYFKEYKFAPCEILHTSVGTLIHATLEDLNRFAIAGRYDEITEELIKKWFALNYAKMQESTGLMLSEERRKSALDQVLNYFDKRKEHIRKVWKAEEKVELVLPEYILQGVIDLIEDDDGKIEIVDYKTGRKPDSPEKSAQVEHYRKQLEIYAYLISERYKKNVSRMHLYYTNEAEENPLVTFEYSKNCVDKEIEDVSQTVRKIEDKRFDAKAENDYSCRYCDMKYMCKKVKNYD